MLKCVEGSIIFHGFVHGYTNCVFHGEGFSWWNTPHSTNTDETFDRQDGIDQLLQDAFRNVENYLRNEGVREWPSEYAKRIFKLVE